MTRRPARRRGRKRPPKKPLDNFLGNVAEMIETVFSTAVFGAGAVLLGKALGSPAPPRIELPPGLPPEVAAEWARLTGMKEPAKRRMNVRFEGDPRRGRSSVVENPDDPPRPAPVRLLKGPDGIYRPEPGS